MSLPTTNDLLTWVSIYNSGQRNSHDMRSLTVQSVQRAVIRHRTLVGLFCIAHDGSLPRAVCRVSRSGNNHSLSLSDFAVLSDGIESANSLFESVLRYARAEQVSEVCLWLHNDAERLSDIVSSFGLHIRRLRTRMSIQLDHRVEQDYDSLTMLNNKIAPTPPLVQMSLCGSPPLIELLDEWRSMGSVLLNPESISDRLLLYTSAKNRRRVRLQLGATHSPGTCRSHISVRTLQSVLAQLYTSGVREVSVELGTDHDIERVFTDAGFTKECMYIEFVLDIL